MGVSIEILSRKQAIEYKRVNRDVKFTSIAPDIYMYLSPITNKTEVIKILNFDDLAD